MPRQLCQLPVSLTVPRSTQPQHASCSRASLPTYPGGLVGTGPGGDSALLSKPGQAMAETASPVVTPANVLLARASHVAELTQGVGWSPHPQCRVAKGTDMGRVERQPSDNRGQVHGPAHTSPWPCTAQSRNSETMSSPGSARSHLAQHGHTWLRTVTGHLLCAGGGRASRPPGACPSVPTAKRWCPQIIHRECLQRDHSRGRCGDPQGQQQLCCQPAWPSGARAGAGRRGTAQRATRTGGLRRCHSALAPSPILGTRRQSPHSSDMERPG